MKIIILKFLLLIFSISITVVLLILFLPHNTPVDFDLAVIDKDNLLKAVHPPRLILAGGSNVAFGIDSQQIASRYPVHVINMGQDAGLGLLFLLNQIQQNILPHDVVVLCPEYSHFKNLNTDSALLRVLEAYPESIRYLDRRNVISLIYSFTEYFRDKIQYTAFSLFSHQKSPVYRRDGFNANGDMVSHLKIPSKDVSEMEVYIPVKNVFCWDAVEFINKFSDFLHDFRAESYFLFPCLPVIQYEKNEENVEWFYQCLKSHLHSSILSHPKRYVFAMNKFFDSPYHLNAEGRKERTDLIIQDLQSISFQMKP